jgi:hypothetical protein
MVFLFIITPSFFCVFFTFFFFSDITYGPSGAVTRQLIVREKLNNEKESHYQILYPLR